MVRTVLTGRGAENGVGKAKLRTVCCKSIALIFVLLNDCANASNGILFK